MRKLLSILLGAGFLVGGYFIYGSLANTERPVRPKPEKDIQTAFVKKVKNTDIPITVSESGRLMAKNRIELFAEVQGVMERISKDFKPGTPYKKGELMVKIRNNDFYANLQAQKSNLQNLITSILPDLRMDYPEAYKKWDKYLREFDMNKSIGKLPKTTSDKEKFFITGKNIYTTYYQTKNLEIILGKYRLSAPFKGVLTDAVVNPGSLVRPGQKLGEFIDPSSYEMEVFVSKTLLPSLSIGKKVKIHDPESHASEWEGSIIRINGKVNLSTQTVQVFILVKGNNLKEGMYLDAIIEGEPKSDAFEVQRNILINETSLYIVKDGVLAVQNIEPVYYNKETVVVRGLNNGDLILSKPLPGSYAGLVVKTNEATE